MKAFIQRLVTFTVAAVLWSQSAGAESFSVLLQKAIYAEETGGNLDSAIKIQVRRWAFVLSVNQVDPSVT